MFRPLEGYTGVCPRKAKRGGTQPARSRSSRSFLKSESPTLTHGAGVVTLGPDRAQEERAEHLTGGISLLPAAARLSQHEEGFRLWFLPQPV